MKKVKKIDLKEFEEKIVVRPLRLEDYDQVVETTIEGASGPFGRFEMISSRVGWW